MFWKKKKSVKFIATFELGRLATWLRILGFDTVYFRKGTRAELIIKSLREGRVILTREAGMARYTGTRMLRIKDDRVENQIRQVSKEMRLKCKREDIFTRCVLCNEPIEAVDKESVENKVPPYVYKTQEKFFSCVGCGKIYWKGTHLKLAQSFLKERANQ